jgi:hypothetical protein
MVAALATALGEGLAPGFMGFFVPRVMNGFFSGVAQGVSCDTCRYSLGLSINPETN